MTKVLYATMFKTTKYNEIDYDKIDEYDFENKPFNEVFIKPEYVHPYFDFDSIETLDDYNDVIEWLDELKDEFGEYVIGGYTNNEEVFGHLYKYIPNAHHVLSLHVIFYESN